MNNEPTPEPDFKFIQPEEMTPELRDAAAVVWNAELAAGLEPLLRKLWGAAGEAAKAQDAEAMQRVRQSAKAYEVQLSRWHDGLGHRASDNLMELQKAFCDLGDDILKALAGEHPEQRDDADEDCKK